MEVSCKMRLSRPIPPQMLSLVYYKHQWFFIFIYIYLDVCPLHGAGKARSANIPNLNVRFFTVLFSISDFSECCNDYQQSYHYITLLYTSYYSNNSLQLTEQIQELEIYCPNGIKQVNWLLSSRELRQTFPSFVYVIFLLKFKFGCTRYPKVLHFVTKHFKFTILCWMQE